MFYHTANRKARGGAGAARCVWGGKGENIATAKLGTFGNGALELSYQRKVSEKVALVRRDPGAARRPLCVQARASHPSLRHSGKETETRSRGPLNVGARTGFGDAVLP